MCEFIFFEFWLVTINPMRSNNTKRHQSIQSHRYDLVEYENALKMSLNVQRNCSRIMTPTLRMKQLSVLQYDQNADREMERSEIGTEWIPTTTMTATATMIRSRTAIDVTTPIQIVQIRRTTGCHGTIKAMKNYANMKMWNRVVLEMQSTVDAQSSSYKLHFSLSNLSSFTFLSAVLLIEIVKVKSVYIVHWLRSISRIETLRPKLFMLCLIDLDHSEMITTVWRRVALATSTLWNWPRVWPTNKGKEMTRESFPFWNPLSTFKWVLHSSRPPIWAKWWIPSRNLSLSNTTPMSKVQPISWYQNGKIWSPLSESTAVNPNLGKALKNVVDWIEIKSMSTNPFSPNALNSHFQRIHVIFQCRHSLLHCSNSFQYAADWDNKCKLWVFCALTEVEIDDRNLAFSFFSIGVSLKYRNIVAFHPTAPWTAKIIQLNIGSVLVARGPTVKRRFSSRWNSNVAETRRLPINWIEAQHLFRVDGN